MAERKYIVFDDNAQGPEWVVAYLLAFVDLDDSMEDNDIIEISLNAEDFETAVKYAEQYLKKMQIEEPETWKDAQILSVQLR